MMHDYTVQTCLRLTLLAPQKAAARANFRSFTIPPPPSATLYTTSNKRLG